MALSRSIFKWALVEPQRRAAQETPLTFVTRTATNAYLNYLLSPLAFVASAVETGGLLAPSGIMAKEFICIRTALQYPKLVAILFPGDLAKKTPYDFVDLM